MEVTVIIVTLDRPECVRRCLGCLAVQTGAAEQVIVVDASKGRATAEVVAEFRDVEYLRNENGFGRMTASRNIGLLSAKGDVIAFLDDDAFAAPEWLESLLKPYEEERVGGVGGRALNRQPGEEQRGINKIGQLDKDGRLSGFFAADPGGVIEVVHLMGCNMSFRRDVLARLGGFREDYPGISGLREDSDMCLRVRSLGYKLLFNPAASVEHIGAPQAVGHRFDLRYTYYAERNHLVLLIRNFGLGSSRLWRYLIKNSLGMAVDVARRIAAGVARCIVGFAGMIMGVFCGVSLLIRTGRDAARNDAAAHRVRDALGARAVEAEADRSAA